MSDFRILKNAVNYDTQGYVDEQLLYKHGLVSSESLTKNLTYLYGKDSDLYPLLTNTQGMREGKGSRTTTVDRQLKDYRYTWPVMGRLKNTSVCRGLMNATDTTPCIANRTAVIMFEDAIFIPTHVITSPINKIQCRLMEGAPKKNARGFFEYEVIMLGGSNFTYIPAEDLESGMSWVMGATAVAASKTDGIYAHVATPGKMTNQLGYHRYSFEITGNVANKVTMYEISAYDSNNKQTKEQMWLPDQIVNWQSNIKVNNEYDLWTSKYNRDEYGRITDKDARGELIPRGAGLLQQIKHGGYSDTYFKLTLKRFDSTLNRIYHDQTDVSDYGFMEVVMYTGRGGREMFSEMIKRDANSKDYYQKLGDAEIKELDGKLTYGAYGDRYKTVHGNILTIKNLAMLDKGRDAEMQKANGMTYKGHPYDSYNYYFVDHSTYAGERNVQLVEEEGYYMEGIYRGLTKLPPMWQALAAKDTALSTRKDIATYEVKGSHGVVMLKNTTSFVLEFNP